MENKYNKAISNLYCMQEKFSQKVAPIFELNNWKWSLGLNDPVVPTIDDISATISSLIWEITKEVMKEERSRYCCSTGRIEVCIYETDYGDIYSEIKLVPYDIRDSYKP